MICDYCLREGTQEEIYSCTYNNKPHCISCCSENINKSLNKTNFKITTNSFNEEFIKLINDKPEKRTRLVLGSLIISKKDGGFIICFPRNLFFKEFKRIHHDNHEARFQNKRFITGEFNKKEREQLIDIVNEYITQRR